MDGLFDDGGRERLARHLAWRAPEAALAGLLDDRALALAERAERLRRRLSLPTPAGTLAALLAVELCVGHAALGAASPWPTFERRVVRGVLRTALGRVPPAARSLVAGGRRARRPLLAVLVDREPLGRVARRERLHPALVAAELRRVLARGVPGGPPGAGGAVDVRAALAALAAGAPPAAAEVRAGLRDRLRAEGLAALDGLATRILGDALGRSGWASWPRRGPRGSWAALERLVPGPPARPRAGESPGDVARRLLAARGRLDDGLGTGLWRARLARVERGPRGGLDALPTLPRRAGARERRLLLRERVELALDAGLVRAALRALAGQPSAVAADPVLPRLAAWARWAAGDEGVPPPAPPPVLPARVVAALAEPSAAAPAEPPPPAVDAARVGATVLAVVAAGGEPLAVDAIDRARTAPRAGWARPAGDRPERRDARGCPESVADAGAVALVLVPIRSLGGERVGHLHLEFEHRLAPTDSELEALAAPWVRVLARRARGLASTVAEDRDVAEEPCDRRDLVARAAARAGEALPGAAAAWVVPAPRAGRPRFVSGATSNAPPPALEGAARALGDGRSAAAVADGAAVALGSGGAAWVARSRSRRTSASLAVAMARRAPRLALALEAAELAEGFRARRGWSPLVGLAAGGVATGDLRRAARGPWPVAVVGPAGSGRRTAARLVLGLLGLGATREHALGEPLAPAAAAIVALPRGGAGGARDRALLRLAARDAPTLAVCESARDVPPGWTRVATRARRGRRARRVPALLEAIARDRGRPTPQATPRARAALWRAAQRLETGALRRLLDAACDGCAGLELALRDVERAERALGVTALARWPSRAPDPALVGAALCATRTAGGRVNKRAAARLLGWDVGTLNRRLADAAARRGTDRTHRAGAFDAGGTP